jgi:undecaprenyl-diphosphatase
MLLEFAVELALFALLVACGYIGVVTYIRLRQPGLRPFFLKRRLAIIGFLMLLVAGTKLFEDVLAGESGVIDKQALLFVHEKVPAGLTGFFTAVTLAGSAAVVVPSAVLAASVLAVLKRRSESLLVLGSLAAAATLVFTIKTAAGRVRPNLWDVQWYWGSSFPSGHTLHTAAVCTALALCAGRLWPRSASWAMCAALGWTSLVALSRLVLGVHWPTDVLAAMCLGAFIPLAISMAMELRAESVAPGKTH